MKKIVLFILLSFLLVGCSSSNKFIGTWYHYDEDEIIMITFSKDNNCIFEENEYKQDCTYKFDDKKITISATTDELNLDYNFVDNYLIIGDIRFYKDLKESKDNKDSNEINNSKEFGNRRIQTIKMPNVVGMDIEEAKKILIKAGLTLNIVYKEDDFYEGGRVINTIPDAGRSVDKNTVVDVFVSSNFKKYIIEDYKGKNYYEVKTKLESLYDMIVIVEKIKTDDIVDDMSAIIGQSLKPGTEITVSEDDPTTITLYIYDID